MRLFVFVARKLGEFLPHMISHDEIRVFKCAKTRREQFRGSRKPEQIKINKTTDSFISVLNLEHKKSKVLF